MAKGAKEVSFEEGMKRLEATIERMETRDLPLSQVIEKYEEGMALVKGCEEQLAAAERKIELLMRSQTGEVTVSELKKEELF